MTTKTATPTKKRSFSIDKSERTINWDLPFDDLRQENPFLTASDKEAYNKSKGGNKGERKIHYDILGFSSTCPIKQCIEEGENAGYEVFSFAEVAQLIPRIKMFCRRNITFRRRIALLFIDQCGEKKIVMITRKNIILGPKKLSSYKIDMFFANGPGKFHLAVKKEK